MTDTLPRLTAALADRYRVERELGAGGMATVFLAHDLKHDRPVAIKVVHPELGAALGAERFLAEIKTTARLQHPHILPLLESGDADGLLYYVMPFVAGESLRQRLTREKQLPIEVAVRLARDVADALGHAHAQGVVHRDIKPENILLQEGHALVADFGIALAVQQAGGARMTQTGLSLGTPQYMAPEQAMGERVIDARADVYALGAVTYEMLTGDPPFTGSTVQAIVAKVLTERPVPPTATRDTVPPRVERAVLRALAKLPADRFGTAAEFGAAVVAGALEGETGDGAREAAAQSRRPWFLLAWSAASGAAALAAFAAGRATPGAGADPLGSIGRSMQVTWEPGLELTPAISPDGKTVVYAAGNGTASKLYTRGVAGGRATPLSDDTAAVEWAPQWSPDGTRILYLRDGQVFSVEAGGGSPRPELPPRTGGVNSGAWAPDGKRLAFVVADSLFVRELDGTVRRLAVLPQPSMCQWGPRDLIACVSGNPFYLAPGLAFGNVAPSSIAAVHVRTGVVHFLTDRTFTNESPAWSADGHAVLFVSNRLGPPDIFSVPVAADGAPGGPVRRHTTGMGVSSFTLSASGTLMAYATRSASANVYSSPLPAPNAPAAHATLPRTQHTTGQQVVENIAISRDGSWLFYDSDLAGNSDIYRMRLPQGAPERLTNEVFQDFAPDPSPDGRVVLFHSPRGSSRDIYLLPLDGGALQRVTDTRELQEAVPRWSPDGTRILAQTLSFPGEVLMGDRAGDGWRFHRMVEGSWPAWSPDGRSFSYATSLLGGSLRVTPADTLLPRTLYAAGPGAPLAETSAWSDDGRTIYFKTHDSRGDAHLMAIPVQGGAAREVMRLGDEFLRSGRYGVHIRGGRVYYVLVDQQANVSVVELQR